MWVINTIQQEKYAQVDEYTQYFWCKFVELSIFLRRMKNFRLQLGLLSLLICLSTQLSFSQTTNKKNDGKAAPQAAAPITQKYSLYFDVGKDKIKPEGYRSLDSLVALLQTNPNVRRIQVNGYADTTGGA